MQTFPLCVVLIVVVVVIVFQSRVTYEIASDLTYLDMCMNEAMRLFPPGFMSVILFCFTCEQALSVYVLQ